MEPSSAISATVKGSLDQARFPEILTEPAQAFLVSLHRRFEPLRRECLAHREKVQAELDDGAVLSFLEETADLRDEDWTVSPPPEEVLDRRVEITGPVDRKMVINALNSGANVFMADFEDSNSPTWENNLNGQINMFDAVRRTIAFTNEQGKEYKLNDKTAILMVRPRGWHLV